MHFISDQWDFYLEQKLITLMQCDLGDTWLRTAMHLIEHLLMSHALYTFPLSVLMGKENLWAKLYAHFTDRKTKVIPKSHYDKEGPELRTCGCREVERTANGITTLKVNGLRSMQVLMWDDGGGGGGSGK